MVMNAIPLETPAFSDIGPVVSRALGRVKIAALARRNRQPLRRVAN
jgi:hypothetical protein